MLRYLLAASLMPASLEPLMARVAEAPALPQVEQGRCWEPVLANEVVGDHVIVEYADGVDPALAGSVVGEMEEALRIAVDELGWRLPPGMPTHKLVVYLAAAEEGGGATRLVPCGDGEMPVIAFTQDAIVDPVWRAGTVAHELHHAIQYAYGEPELWFWEATATYMQTKLAPGDAWTFWLPAWSERPWMGMAATSQRDLTVFGHMYGMLVWPMYLEDTYGEGTLRALWETSDAVDGVATQDDLLATLDTTVVAELPGWYASLVSGALHPRLPAPLLEAEVTALPATGEAAQLPETHGAAFVAIDPAVVGEFGVRVAVSGDPEVDWTAVVVRQAVDGVVRWDALPSNGGVASGDLLPRPDDAAVWLVMSPAGDVPRGGWPVAWELTEIEPPQLVTEGCGCRQSRFQTWWWFVLLGACVRSRGTRARGADVPSSVDRQPR